MAGHVQKQPASQKQWTKTDKSERAMGTSKTIEKKKQKPKTAPAGGGAKPPSKPPKGPTGGPKDEGKRPDYKGSKDTDSGMSLRKGSYKEKTKDPKPNDRQFKESNYNRSMAWRKNSTKKDK